MAAASGPSDDYYDLGTYRRSITSPSAEAQLWCNRGLLWCYGFNHEEAVACFERALAVDSECAFAYWGVAYALGPNYNKPWDFFDRAELETTVQRTHRMVERARACAAAGHASPVETALIEALQARYPRDRPAEEPSDGDTSTGEGAVWNAQYADAMERVYDAFAADADVAALAADALMNLTPWRLWDLAMGKPAADARTPTIQRILEAALARPGGMAHPGLLHLYIHFIEMSPRPEAGLPAADALRGLVPDAGHLNHMPTHIDVLVGDYARVITWNQRAFAVDEQYLARAGARNFYTLYRMHDYHFCIYGALFAGQSRVALETAARLEAALPEALLRVASPPMADWLEGFMAMRVHALVRFGRWADIGVLAPPADAVLYCTTTAMVHYAQAVALAATGHVDEATAAQARFRTARARVPASRMLFNNRCVDILGVAAALLDGEVLYRQGAHAAAFARLREAVARDDALAYDEPWGWMQPARHALGALLLEQGHAADAAVVYAEDLGLVEGGDEGEAAVPRLPRARQHPNNVWALHGYHECLVKLGRTDEARALEPALKKALEGADVEIKASCYCRAGAGAGA